MAELPKTISPGPLRTAPQHSWKSDMGARWSRFSSRFTRENVVSNLKTIAWVIPLTLLIWIYAEREQVDTTKDVSIPFELVSVDPNRVVSLKPPQDKNLILELQGPRAKVQDVKDKLRGGTMPQGLRIEMPNAITAETVMDTLPLIRNQKIFIDNGVTVMNAQPLRIDVLVDQLIEREARIIRPPDIQNLDATFDPPIVKVRGPASVLAKAERTPRAEYPGKLVLYGDLHDQAAKPPSHYDVTDVQLRRPPELDDERVTISGLSTVKASVDVRNADKELDIRSLPVSFDVTDNVWDKYAVTEFKGALANVKVIGPPEIIDNMQKPDFEPKPKARVIITPQDAGDRRSKPVIYDLPKGVHVAPKDENRTVEFRLVDKSTLAPPL